MVGKKEEFIKEECGNYGNYSTTSGATADHQVRFNYSDPRAGNTQTGHFAIKKVAISPWWWEDILMFLTSDHYKICSNTRHIMHQ